MEIFGDERPIERRAVNIHRVLEHVRRLAGAGFAAHVKLTEVYDPSLPPAWANRDQLVQVLVEPHQERGRGDHRRPGALLSADRR